MLLATLAVRARLSNHPTRFVTPSSSSSNPASAPRFLPLLILLFIGSGCAALIYEIVWFQLLQLVVGSSSVSLGVLLGTFMGGMCIGSLLLPRFISSSRHPLLVYAVLEVGIAVLGILILFAVPMVGKLYLAMVGHGMPGIFLRAAVCVICLLPPTILMGATLPAIARWIESTPRGVSWLGFFYGGNTFGAVAGCVLAGFYLLRVHDMEFATYVAAGLNIFVALVAVAVAKVSPYRSTPESATFKATDITPARSAAPVLISIGLSGFCALAAEVVWARILSLMLGATVYTFSIILAVFLTGLGIGSSVGSVIARFSRNPRFALGCCQFLQVATIAWAAYALSYWLPYWPIDSAALAASPWNKFESDIARCALAIMPAALLWGASFPLALAGLAGPDRDPAQLVGRAYAANTLGAIAGAVGASMLFIPTLGTQHTQAFVVITALVSAVIVFAPKRGIGLVSAGAAAAIAILVAIKIPRIPWQLVAYGRQTAVTDYGAKPLYFGEGMNSTVAVAETEGGARFFHVSGKTEASSLAKDMRLQYMLGHIPALLHPNPKSVLIVGCGAGVTAGTFILHPSVERIVICDIERLIPKVVADYFAEQNNGVVRSPKVEIIYDDARHYVATTKEKFDIVTSDPIHPWVKGSAVLYSQEYFELCRSLLKPGGLVTQWVPLYESDVAVVQSEIATFYSVYPHGTIWGNDDEGFGYDTVMLGQNEPLKIDLDALQRRFDSPEFKGVRDALSSVWLGSAQDLLSTYAGRKSDLEQWLVGAEINRDKNLRLQYLAGLQLDSYTGAAAYGEMLGYRRFPTDIFTGSPERIQELRSRLNLVDAPAAPTP